jgi:hypothetical protein
MRLWSSSLRRGREDTVEKLIVGLGATIGGYVGWYLGDRFGFMTAFMLSMVGTGAGMYLARRFSRDYF